MSHISKRKSHFAESHEDNLTFSQDLGELPSFDDARLEDSTADPTNSLTSLRNIPDYDADLEQDFSADPDLDLDETLTSDAVAESRHGAGMEFKDTHFKESSESGGDEGPALEEDEEHLAAGLRAMPDVEDVLEYEQRESEHQRATLLGQAQAMIASDVMAHTVSNLMASTMTGLSRLGETVRSAAAGVAQPAAGGDAAGDQGRLTESVDSDALIAEFEFLEDEDLDVMSDNTNKDKK